MRLHRKVIDNYLERSRKTSSRFLLFLSLVLSLSGFVPGIQHHQHCRQRSNHSFSYYGVWPGLPTFLFWLFWLWFWWRWIVYLRKWCWHWRDNVAEKAKTLLWSTPFLVHEWFDAVSGMRHFGMECWFWRKSNWHVGIAKESVPQNDIIKLHGFCFGRWIGVIGFCERLISNTRWKLRS